MPTILIFGPKSLTSMDVVLDALQEHKINVNDKTELITTGDSDFSKMLTAHFSSAKITTFKPEWKNLEREGAVVKTGAYGKYNSKAIFHRDEDMLDYLQKKKGKVVIIEQPGETDSFKKLATSKELEPLLFNIYKSSSKEVLYRL